MRPDRINIQCVAGDTYTHIYDYVDEETGLPVDLTSEVVIFTVFVRLVETYVLTDGDGLTVTPLTGRIQLDLDSIQTEALRGRGDVRYTIRLDTEERTIAHGHIGVFNTP